MKKLPLFLREKSHDSNPNQPTKSNLNIYLISLNNIFQKISEPIDLI